ncbi:ABC transporter ATP-binding protein [Pseudonocardia petroleophila]|uniref:ABC-type quaternary amine transporter n=1 Tax=Pseudonocardia petroleophila TaxID=37331 RepID=A0A7G7MRM9_9PSEU|nr:ATP-binding cassette domain-containing protein [Pseudonocardia petroleophila]QNG55440.1 ATP-binding cassette domain-containing protein [Pseudonocardia petroleophila]
MIALEGVSKTYPKQDVPAVRDLTLEVPDGTIAMFIGPSGCGKTTTLKMMNRLIEPTSGRILLAGEDVTDVDADQLRRRIGYVIQQVGLFPHFTIGENIAVVPKMLGWDRKRVTARVDELLHLVGMEPAQFRDRYPRQLSGGQQQRVGVARGLAADPAVMLMDEPFGAIDPITRERLQDEFLELQRQIAKTICFVTHDLTEAVKLGDRIAVFGPGGVLEQYDTPEKILTEPANEFVAEFVGSGAAVRRLSLLGLDRLLLEPVVAQSEANGREVPVYTADAQGRPTAWAALPGAAGLPPLRTVPITGTVYDAVDVMLDGRAPLVLVVDDAGRAQGALRWDALVGEMQTKGRVQ